MSELVLSTLEEGVRTIALNRPEVRNALSFESTAALTSAFTQATADTETRCVVLTGRGGAFCSGADLKAVMAAGSGTGDIDDRIRELHALVRAVREAPLPVIAMVDGPAVGFGCDLALACDIRIASTRAYFAELFVRIGLIPDGGGSYLLPRLLGLGKALELLYTGERVGAEEAVRIGMCNRAVAVDLLETQTYDFARSLAKGPALALRLIKQTVAQNLGADYATALDREREAQLECLKSPDLVEGVMAFFEKREPVFRGGRGGH